MRIIANDLNVDIGPDESRLTWEEFKEYIETYKGWTYDPDTLSFYHYFRGSRREVSKFKLMIIACTVGYSESLSDHLTWEQS
ncbi:MAG: hypothetical protein WC248_02275 [Candidatus Methanomethylophilaceae archaeon]|jgi:hypothetical protein